MKLQGYVKRKYLLKIIIFFLRRNPDYNRNDRFIVCLTATTKLKLVFVGLEVFLTNIFAHEKEKEPSELDFVPAYGLFSCMHV